MRSKAVGLTVGFLPVQTLDANDAAFKYDKQEQMALLDSAPWSKE